MPHKLAYKGEFQPGQTVYLKTDPEQYERLILAVSVYVGGSHTYTLVCGTEKTEHEEEELSEHRQL